MIVPIVDTHCHIDLPEFDADRLEALERAREGGVKAMVAVGYNPERWESTRRLGEDHPNVVRSVGLHPNDAERWAPALEEALRAECRHDDVVAIGETGLDFYRDRASHSAQELAFRRQLDIARELNLPVIIHQRSAEHDVLRVLRDYAPLRGVMHCFTGDERLADECVGMGLHLGVGGVVTFPKSETLRVALASAPRDRVVVETDAPFIAPQSRRGRRNEPSFVVEALRVLASLWEMEVESAAGITTMNAIALFGSPLGAAVEEGMSEG